MSSTQKRSSVGCLRHSVSLFFSCLLFLAFLLATIFFVISIVVAVQAIRLPASGIQTQATVVDVAPTTCGKTHTPGLTYTVQFTDQAGHVQTNTLTCESIPTLSRGNSITIVYSPGNPLIALPNDVSAFPIAGVVLAILFALIDLAMLLCFIFWVRHERNTIGPLLRRRIRADSRQRRVAEQVMFPHPTSDSYVKDEKWTSGQEQLDPSQLTLFEAQDAQEEKPAEH